MCVTRPAPAIQDVADAIRGAFPSYARALPRGANPLPRWMLLPAMRLAVTREAYSYTRAMLGRRVDFDTGLTESTLGVRFCLCGESAVDTVAWLLARGA